MVIEHSLSRDGHKLKRFFVIKVWHNSICTISTGTVRILSEGLQLYVYVQLLSKVPIFEQPVRAGNFLLVRVHVIME